MCRGQLARSGLKSSRWNSCGPTKSRRSSMRSKLVRMHFMSQLNPLFTYRVRINTLALSAQLPTVYIFRENVEAGGLLSYGANLPDLYRRAAAYVDKILRGAKPADLPVDHPTKFDLIINLTTAKALGTIPPTILVRADEVIECDGGSSLQGWVGRLRGQLWRGHSNPVRCGISAYC